MEWESLLKDLINMIESTAPELWEIAMRQVWVSVIQRVIFFLFCLIGSTALFKVGSWCGRRHEEAGSPASDWEIGRFFSYAASAVLIIICMIVFVEIVGRVMNPEYYAIWNLMYYVR